VEEIRNFRRDERGQSLVEFSLALPVLLLLIFGVVEWSFVMNTSASVNFASRDGAMLAAEGGTTVGTDCMVLSRIERDLVSPALQPRVQQVEIFWADRNGVQVGTANETYLRGSTKTCTYADGSSLTVPYAVINDSYPESARCDVLAGCGGPHTTVDTVGVKITYQHQWATYIGQTIAPTLTFTKSTAIRIEPQF
jgi:Flp pilus assembly protein TadG